MNHPEQHPETTDPPDDQSGRPTVLVVDDNDDVRESLGDALDLGGYDTAYAGNGAEALAYLNAHTAPAAILTDLNMPVMNGWELVRRLRSTRFGRIPVLVVSGSDLGNKAPQHRVLRKPVTLDDLLSAVRDLTHAA